MRKLWSRHMSKHPELHHSKRRRETLTGRAPDDAEVSITYAPCEPYASYASCEPGEPACSICGSHNVVNRYDTWTTCITCGAIT